MKTKSLTSVISLCLFLFVQECLSQSYDITIHDANAPTRKEKDSQRLIDATKTYSDSMQQLSKSKMELEEHQARMRLMKLEEEQKRKELGISSSATAEKQIVISEREFLQIITEFVKYRAVIEGLKRDYPTEKANIEKRMIQANDGAADFAKSTLDKWVAEQGAAANP